MEETIKNFFDVALIPGIAAFLSGLGTWVFARRKAKVEVDGNYLENIERSLSMYNTVIENSEKQIGKITTLNEKLLDENYELKKQITNLRCEMEELRLEIDRLKRQVESNSSKLKK